MLSILPGLFALRIRRTFLVRLTCGAHIPNKLHQPIKVLLYLMYRLVWRPCDDNVGYSIR